MTSLDTASQLVWINTTITPGFPCQTFQYVPFQILSLHSFQQVFLRLLHLKVHSETHQTSKILHLRYLIEVWICFSHLAFPTPHQKRKETFGLPSNPSCLFSISRHRCLAAKNSYINQSARPIPIYGHHDNHLSTYIANNLDPDPEQEKNWTLSFMELMEKNKPQGLRFYWTY